MLQPLWFHLSAVVDQISLRLTQPAFRLSANFHLLQAGQAAVLRCQPLWRAVSIWYMVRQGPPHWMDSHSAASFMALSGGAVQLSFPSYWGIEFPTEAMHVEEEKKEAHKRTVKSIAALRNILYSPPLFPFSFSVYNSQCHTTTSQTQWCNPAPL